MFDQADNHVPILISEDKNNTREALIIQEAKIIQERHNEHIFHLMKY